MPETLYVGCPDCEDGYLPHPSGLGHVPCRRCDGRRFVVAEGAAEELERLRGRVAAMEAEHAALMALLVEPWTRDDGRRGWKINLARFETAETLDEAITFVLEAGRKRLAQLRAAAGLGPDTKGG